MPVCAYTTLDDPRANLVQLWRRPTAINEAGTSVGIYVELTWQHGFLYSGGIYTTIDDPWGPTAPLLAASMTPIRADRNLTRGTFDLVGE